MHYNCNAIQLVVVMHCKIETHDDRNIYIFIHFLRSQIIGHLSFVFVVVMVVAVVSLQKSW